MQSDSRRMRDVEQMLESGSCDPTTKESARVQLLARMASNGADSFHAERPVLSSLVAIEGRREK